MTGRTRSICDNNALVRQKFTKAMQDSTPKGVQLITKLIMVPTPHLSYWNRTSTAVSDEGAVIQSNQDKCKRYKR
jgi:hypothetical protein